MLSRTFGAVTVIALQDAEGPFFQPRAAAFPDAGADHWRRADELDPDAVRSGEWWLRFRSYALRFDDGRVVLVDAGVGPADAPASSWAPVPGQLPDELAAAGISRDDVDTVVLTHLHTDHIGWAVFDGSPYFPQARYLLQSREVSAVSGSSVDDWLVRPLRGAGQLSEVDGEVKIDAAVRVVPTPGHTPGHQSVVLASGGQTLLLTGDLLVHAVQLVDPDLAYAYESDPAVARASRSLLSGAAVLATPHLGVPFFEL